MHTLNLRVDDSIFDYVKTMLDGFIKEKKIEIIEDDYDYENNCPPELIVSNVEEVRRRVYEAEASIKVDGGISEDKFWKSVDKHLDNL